MKMILKECEDKDGCKGEGSIHEISRPMKNFKYQQWNLSWKNFEVKIFQKNKKCGKKKLSVQKMM